MALRGWGGAPEGNATIRQAWPANRREKPSALPVQETMPFPREPEDRPKPPAFQSRKLGRMEETHEPYGGKAEKVGIVPRPGAAG